MRWLACFLWVLSCSLSFYLGQLPGTQSNITRLPASTIDESMKLVGQQVYISVGDGLLQFKAKVDTGAESSSMHATNIKMHLRYENKKRIPFVSYETIDENKKTHVFLKRVSRIDDVKSSNGKSIRYYITERIVLEGKYADIDVNLADRSDMTFKFLLGKSALLRLGVFVDPQKDIIVYDNDGPRYVYKAD